MFKLTRPSPALVVATLSLFVAAGGGAWAATTPSDSALYARATSPKAKIASRGPRGPRGATGPSDAFVINGLQNQLQLTPGTDTRLIQLRLTLHGSYIVTASTELAGNAAPGENVTSCTLLQNSNPVGEGASNLQSVAAFSDTMTITAAVSTNDGSNVSLTCNPDGLSFARNAVITALRVGSLHRETP